MYEHCKSCLRRHGKKCGSFKNFQKECLPRITDRVEFEQREKERTSYVFFVQWADCVIKLNDTLSFAEWAESQLPFINAVNDYLKDYETEIDENRISQLSTEKILAMQEILYGYFAALVEPYSKSEMYHKIAVARETRKNHEAGMPPSVAKTVAEEKCGNEIMINEILHRLNSTIDKLLIVLSVRLSYEKSLFFGANHGQPSKPGKETPF